MSSSRSGEGRGVSCGGSVGTIAGTEPSRTIRSSPAGVLSASTRAVSLSTRKVCAIPIGTTAVAPGASSNCCSPASTVSFPRKEWEAGLTGGRCISHHVLFVDRDYRLKGLAAAAVRGALDLIAKAGGGVVEGYPHDLQGENPVPVPLQRHAQPLRGGRFQRPATQRKEELRDAHSRFSSLSLLMGSRRVSPGAL